MRTDLASTFATLAELAEERWPGFLDHVTIRLEPEARVPPRYFARCRLAGDQVVVELSPELAAESDDRVLGVLVHELGHAVALVLQVPVFDLRGAELLADALGSLVSGLRVRYDASDIQCLDHGALVRPVHLG